jgi:hypothetical protein
LPDGASLISGEHFYLPLNRVKLSDVLQGLRCNLDLVADMQVKEL